MFALILRESTPYGERNLKVFGPFPSVKEADDYGEAYIELYHNGDFELFNMDILPLDSPS